MARTTDSSPGSAGRPKFAITKSAPWVSAWPATAFQNGTPSSGGSSAA
ncbi:hypothetical protein ACEN8K_33725 [Variovorax sp. CT11-76]